jgi:geranylgeranyl reductase family protein
LLYDAVVVGSGPSGSVLAYRLARHGLKTLVLEKAPLPRYKPCAGGVPLKTIHEIPYDVLPVVESKATGGIATYMGQHTLKADLRGDFAWLVMRDKFDHFLLKKAIEAGAACLDGHQVSSVEEQADHVVVSTGRESWTAKVVIGADGVNSLVARAVGLLEHRQVGVALEAELEVPHNALEQQGAYATFDFGALPNGYGWIFPKQQHLSVGVFRAQNAKAKDLKSRLQRFIDSQPVLKENRIFIQQGHRIPLGGQKTPLHTAHCLLVGDAANLADPWMGEGIYYAVRSANLAADAILNAFQSGNFDFSSYTRRINKEIVADFHVARRIARWVYRYPTQLTRIFSRSSVMQNAVFINIRGDLNFKQLWRHLIFNLPIILTQYIRKEGASLE